MSKILFSLLLFFSLEGVRAQSYSYTFQGALTHEKESMLHQELTKLNFEKVRINYKSEIPAGQILLFISDETTPGENEPNWSPADIKNLMIQYELEPGEFKSIKE